MRIIGVDHVYIICCGKFKDREAYMRNVKEKFGFDQAYFTLTMDDKSLNFSENSYWESLTQHVIDQYYITDRVERQKELIITGQDIYAPRDISLADIAVSINHLLVWKDIVKNNHKNVLVLEDDILFFQNSLDHLQNKILQNLPDDYDLISLEDGAHMHATMYGHDITEDKYLYKIDCGRMRCTGAYLMNGKAAKKIVSLHEKKRWTLEIDHVIDLYGKLGLLNIYWAEPCIFTQGSQKGIYKSGVQTKNIKRITNLEMLKDFKY